jgi:hypothetical protein
MKTRTNRKTNNCLYGLSEKDMRSKMNNKQTKDEKDEILELIRWIDKQKCKLFKERDWLSGWWLGFVGLVVILIPVLLLGVVISYIYLIYHVSNIDVTLSFIVISLTLITLTVSYFSLVGQFRQENIVRANFGKALKLRQFNPNEKILLKALIKIKAKNPEFDLEEIYNKNNSMFTIEKLMEKLYEQKVGLE